MLFLVLVPDPLTLLLILFKLPLEVNILPPSDNAYGTLPTHMKQCFGSLNTGVLFMKLLVSEEAAFDDDATA